MEERPIRTKTNKLETSDGRGIMALKTSRTCAPQCDRRRYAAYLYMMEKQKV